ncbi:thiol-activated cytolysin family protein [Longitalea luteola]|uniref:thiol-activated cytolysin family protein n=1 Tax=Longitalea luteola TaxID=2812563 RepID=UPI001A962980|nr:thiol-activated cytolysin family protein [Longitalea luteola]
MKKIVLLVCLVQLIHGGLMAQIGPNKQITPIKKFTPLKLKGNVPFLAKGSPVIKYIVPANATNPSFSLQRGTTSARRTVTSTTTSSAPDANGRYCTESIVSEEKGDYTKIVLGNQNDKIYPGAIYYDNAFLSGTYNAPDNLELKPYDITTDLFSASFSGSSIINVQPSFGGVNDGIGELMRRSGNVKNPSLISVEVKSMNSSEQLAFEIGAGFTGYGAELNTSLSSMKATNKNVFIAKLTQVYFSVMLNRADGKLLAANSASYPNLVYVNKVNYGRLGYILISSDSSREAIQAALDFTYSSGSVSASANARLNYQRTLSSMQISGFFFGGDAANTMRLTSVNQLQSFDDYVQNGLRLDPNVAPVAISYELKYLNDNASCATRSTTTYTERQCTPAKGIKIQFHNVAIEDVHSGDCSYAWGRVAVDVYETDNQKRPVKRIGSFMLWNHPANAPNRTVINFADIRAGNRLRPEIMSIPNGTKTITINPVLASENRIMLRFYLNVNTNHKDNDLAALGFHGMNRQESIDKMLNEVFVGSDQIQSRPNDYKYGTYMTGRFCSNTDRVHCFYALFTITNM